MLASSGHLPKWPKQARCFLETLGVPLWVSLASFSPQLPAGCSCS